MGEENKKRGRVRGAEVGSLHVPGVCCAERWWVCTGGSQSGSHTLSSPSSQLAAAHAVFTQVGSGEEMKHVCVYMCVCASVLRLLPDPERREGGKEVGREATSKKKTRTSLNSPPIPHTHTSPPSCLKPHRLLTAEHRQQDCQPPATVCSPQQHTHKDLIFKKYIPGQRKNTPKQNTNSKVNLFWGKITTTIH